MRKAKRTILIAMLILAGFVPVCSAGGARSRPKPPHPTALELLDKYGETQDKVQSFIAKTESLAETVSSNPRYKGKKRYYRTFSEIRSDGEREYALRYMWNNISSPREVKSKDKASYISNLWDGKSYLSYARDERNDLGTVIIDRASKNRTPDKILPNSGDGITMGYCYGDGIRVDSILREGGNVSVRDRLEKVGASECYVLDAKTARGKYTLWIDPKHGYNLAKAEVRRQEGDLSQDRPIPKGTLSFFLENVRFEEVDGVWVPMEWDIKVTANWLNDYLISKIHDKRTAITLNPDHEALGSFVPDDIKNGARVFIPQVPGVHYTWQDGQVVDKDGRVIMDCRPKNASGSAESKPKSAVRKRPSAWELLRKYTEQQAKVTAPQSKERIVHFPKDHSLGKLMIQDIAAKRQIKTFQYWIDGTTWEFFDQAKGDIRIPEGKRLALVISNPKILRDLSPLTELRPDDLYMLTISGNFQGGLKPGDRCMRHIAHLTELKVLNFYNTNITSKGLQFLKNFTSLERLILDGPVNSSGLAIIARLKTLKGLFIRKSNITNKGLRHLEKFTSLEELALASDRISDDGLIYLQKVPSLKYLMISGKNFTDDGLIHLKNIPSLKILNLGWLPITGSGFEHLSNLSNLENLALYHTPVNDKAMVFIKQLPSLVKLNLSHTKVTDKGVAHLAEIKPLKHLTLPHGITDKGLQYLQALKNLKVLELGAVGSGGPISDKGLGYISELQELEQYTVGGKDITDDGLSYITKLKNLKELMLFGCPQVTNQGLAKLTELDSLRTLNLYHINITISGLSSLNALHNLTTLNVHNIRQDNLGLDIQGLTNLEKLSIQFERKSEFRDQDLACLAKLMSLKSLQISHKGISDAGLKHLAGLTSLEHLSVGGKLVTDDGLAHLANMQKLSSLTLTGNFTDIGLRHLEGLEALGNLHIISSHRISAAAKRRLREKIPNLFSFETQLKDVSPRTPQGTRPTRPKSRR